MTFNYLYIVFCVACLFSLCTSDICDTCWCFETERGPTINCHEKQLGTNDMLNFDIFMLGEHRSLNRLIFSKNEIVDLPLNILRKMKQLRSLDLSDNLMTEIHTSVFTDLHILEDLDLSKNLLNTFDDTLLETLPSLLILNLSYNQIAKIEHTIRENATKLLRLDISHNNISEISPDAFAIFGNLRYLDLSFNNIASIPENSLVPLSCLETILIHNNALFLLDLKNYPSTLIELNAGFNVIRSVNYVISQIQVLSLEHNNISEIANEIRTLKQLKHLNISGNSLTTIPNIVFDQIESLDVSYNQLSEIPYTLSVKNFPNLRILNISANFLTRLNFPANLTLHALSINNINSLKDIDRDALKNLNSPINSCLNVSISKNREVTKIDDNAIKHLNICFLDLSYNSLKSVSESLVWRNRNFKEYSINLQGNPFDCNCSLQWMLNKLIPELYHRQPELLDNLRCAAPPVIRHMRMVHWYKWEGEVFCSDPSHFKENLAIEMTSLSNSKSITLESSTGLLTIVGSAIGVLTILVILGLLLTRRLAMRRRRYNRRF